MTRALVDVDGVLADFSNHVLDTVPGGTDVTFADVKTWDIFSLLRDQQAKAMKEFLLQDPEWWRALPVNRLAQAGVAEIRRRVDEVVFVTSPWQSCNGWGYARRAWLHVHFGVKANDVVVSSRKEFISGEWFLDDKPEHVRGWIEERVQRQPQVKAFLFDAPYNQDSSGWFARLTWEAYLADPAAFHADVELL